MPDAITQNLVNERDGLVARVENIRELCADQGRDLNEDDRNAITSARTRVEAIDAQLELLATSFDLDDSIRDRLHRVSPGVVEAATAYPHAGALLWDILHRSTDGDAKRRFDGMMRRAAQHMGTTAANTTPTAGGFDGLIVNPVTGPIIDVQPQGRPFLTALGVQQSPTPLSFMRPRIVDPDFATGVAVQTKEKAELASKKFDVLADTVTLTTVGGYLNVSEQLRALVADSLNIVITQLQRRLAYATEVAGFTELAKTTAEVTLAADADGPTILQAIYDASAMVYANTGQLAEWILMGPQGWARLGGLTDLAGRPLFPYLGASNAPGTSNASTFNLTGPAGLRAIVTPAMTDDTFYVGNGLALEVYEYRYPLMEALEPSLLGRQIAVASSIASYRPTTKEADPSGTPPREGNGAVHLAP